MEETEFENPEISVNDLPDVEAPVYQHVEKSYRDLSILSSSLIFIFLLVVYFAGGLIENLLLKPVYMFSFLLTWAIAFTATVVLSYYSWRWQGYVLREHDILYRTGIFFRSVTAVSFNRVQHCEINQGPLDRLFDLAELTVYTAGGSESDLNLPGLNPEVAHKIKEVILRKTTLDG
jgi:membrane protein YdbS with pleckstrin-like domain